MGASHGDDAVRPTPPTRTGKPTRPRSGSPASAQPTTTRSSFAGPAGRRWPSRRPRGYPASAGRHRIRRRPAVGSVASRRGGLARTSRRPAGPEPTSRRPAGARGSRIRPPPGRRVPAATLPAAGTAGPPATSHPLTTWVSREPGGAVHRLPGVVGGRAEATGAGHVQRPAPSLGRRRGSHRGRCRARRSGRHPGRSPARRHDPARLHPPGRHRSRRSWRRRRGRRVPGAVPHPAPGHGRAGRRSPRRRTGPAGRPSHRTPGGRSRSTRSGRSRGTRCVPDR